MISGRVSKERNGKISIAGPAVNLVFALMFLGLFFLVQDGFIGRIFAFGFLINSWLALFNLLPFWILDGKKVLKWNKLVYFISLGMAISFVVLSWILPLNLF